MTKIIYDCIVRITLTYGSIIGTGVVIAGIAHLFMSHDAMGASAVIGVGMAAIVGRSALEKLKPGDMGGGIPTQKPKPITKPQETQNEAI
jgi:hypothetical protein